MIELVDVSKWFEAPVRLSPDMVCGVNMFETGVKADGVLVKTFWQFCVSTIKAEYVSNQYEDEKTCEVGMSEFCKKIQGEI